MILSRWGQQVFCSELKVRKLLNWLQTPLGSWRVGGPALGKNPLEHEWLTNCLELQSFFWNVAIWCTVVDGRIKPYKT